MWRNSPPSGRHNKFFHKTHTFESTHNSPGRERRGIPPRRRRRRRNDVDATLIPMNKEQAYEILRLDPRRTTVTARDVEKSYRQLLHEHHPDKGGTNTNFLLLQQARRAALGVGEGPAGQNSGGVNAWYSTGGEHRHFVSSKTFPRHLRFMMGSLVVVVIGLNAAKFTAKERKEKRSPGVRAALGLHAKEQQHK